MMVMITIGPKRPVGYNESLYILNELPWQYPELTPLFPFPKIDISNRIKTWYKARHIPVAIFIRTSPPRWFDFMEYSRPSL
jgi:hypothetical protein